MWALFPGDKNQQAVVDIITAGHETVKAVVGGALLDEHLTRTLKERLRDDEGFAEKFILKQDAPLGNMGVKIGVLYMLGAIGKVTRSTMEGIAEVRNFFAHNLGASFDSVDHRFLSAMGKLKLHEQFKSYPHALFPWEKPSGPIPPIEKQRDRFIENLKLCLIMLMRDRMSHITYSNFILSKEDAIARWKQQPIQGKPEPDHERP
jgi:DNA-binding MltR family transcriptional regulator